MAEMQCPFCEQWVPEDDIALHLRSFHLLRTRVGGARHNNGPLGVYEVGSSGNYLECWCGTAVYAPRFAHHLEECGGPVAHLLEIAMRLRAVTKESVE